MQISRLFGAHPVDTEKWHCTEHFDAHIDVWWRLDFIVVSRKMESGQSGKLGSLTTISVSRKS